MQRELGRRFSRRLFEDISSRPIALAQGRASSKSWSLMLAYVLAAAVYTASVLFGIAGVLLLLPPWENLLVVLSGLALVLMCLVARPTFAQAPYHLLSRSEYPALHRLSDLIAQRMGSPAVDGIAISADFSANYRIAGWRRRRYIELGSPLLAILSPRERVAVLAHELSHGANGDPLRGFLLHGSVHTLASWASVIRPTQIGATDDGLSKSPLGSQASIMAIPFQLLMLAASEVIFWAMGALHLLALRQSQRAEYLADLSAATVAGSKEMRSALEKTYLQEVVDGAMKSYVRERSTGPIEATLLAAVQSLTDEDLDRYRSESRASDWQVDSTHPPTAMRVDMLARQVQYPSSDLLSADEIVTMNVEVSRLVLFRQRELVNRSREAIYEYAREHGSSLRAPFVSNERGR
jgi:Zn-dependent protease with chaperone function